MLAVNRQPPPSNIQIEQFLAIAEVNRAIASELDVDKLLQLVANLLHERFGYPFVHIFVLHPFRRWIEFKAGLGLYATHLKNELSFSLDEEGIIPWVAQTGQAVLVNNVYQNVRFKPLSLPDIDIKSELTVPLIFGDEVLGVFDIESEEFDAFTADDLWLLEMLAVNIAIALRNAMLYRSERWRRQAADSLRQIAGVVRSRETLDNILTAILTRLAALLPMTSAAIWLKTDSGYRFKIGYHVEKQPPSGNISHAWFDEITTAGSSLIRRPNDQPPPLAVGFPPRHSALGAVLEVDENVLGVLVLVHRRPNRFGLEAKKLVEIFAGQAAIVIENTDLYHQAREQADINRALLQVAQTVVAASSLAEALNAVAKLTPKLTAVTHCLIFLYSEQEARVTLTAAYGLESLLLPVELSLAEFSDLAAAIKDGQPRPCNNCAQLPPELRQSFISPHFQSLILPLRAQDQTVGALLVANDQPGPLMTGKRRDILTGVAYQAALAIDNAHLRAQRTRQKQLERELKLAQEIQTSFIPREIPALPGWEIATCWKMAHEVGGDFFDLIPIGNDRLLLIIADVADKGLPAALFMARTSSLVRAIAMELDQPADILDRANRLLNQDAGQTMFVTAFCAVLNAKSGQLQYASAGHNPPILVRSSGKATMLKAKGIVLGIVETIKLEQKSIELRDSDGILLYTDGVTEAFNPFDETFGEARLLEAIKTHWHLPAQEFVNAIHKTVRDFAQSYAQSDDFTLLLLRKN